MKISFNHPIPSGDQRFRSREIHLISTPEGFAEATIYQHSGDELTEDQMAAAIADLKQIPGVKITLHF